jgi:hypothetical protein
MRRNFYRLFLNVCLGLTMISLCPARLHAHDLGGNHLHIKGKITTPDGQPVQGAQLQFPGRPCIVDCITGMPAGVPPVEMIAGGTATGPGVCMTTATGDFEFIVRIPTVTSVVIDIDKLGVDKAKLLAHLTKDGFFFRIK